MSTYMLTNVDKFYSKKLKKTQNILNVKIVILNAVIKMIIIVIIEPVNIKC
jgi:hypothetical protein